MIKHKIFTLVYLFILSCSFGTLALADVQQSKDRQWALTEEQWDLVKQGEQLLTMSVMQQAVDAWSLQQGQAIELRYPGGEEGELWVQELKDWLISLAIPSKYLFSVAGSGKAGVIIIRIFKVGDI